jgi:preprotein translocase subunit SecG
LQGILLFFHILVCFFLIIVVLLQSGKSADLAGAFGGYGSQSSFGPRGAASLLSKLTTTLQVVAAHKNKSGSVLDKEKPAAKTQTSQPLKPGTDTAKEQPQSTPVK